MIVVTGATGQLGSLVITELLNKGVPAGQIAAVVRNPAKAAGLAARGVQLRQADYTQPEALAKAFQGADKLLFISSSEVGGRLPQHRNVVDAARKAGVGLVAYTSILRADTSKIGLAAEHRETEALLKASGLPTVLLRNGWYTENYLASIPPALAHGAYIGSAGEGVISSAARADYAAAAAAVLTSTATQAGKVYELAGEPGYTLAQLAAEISRQSGKTVPYVNLPQAEFKAALLGAGLPEGLAELLSDSDAAAASGALQGEGATLRGLIGRPSTPLVELVKAALAQQGQAH